MRILQCLFVALLCVLNALPVKADPRCDCAYDKIEGACTAALYRKKDWITVNSDTRRCSSVVWEINGFPQLSVVTDGTLSEPLLSVPESAKLEVRSCKVCRDSNYPSSSTPTSGRSNPGQQTSPANSPFSTVSGTWSGYTTSLFGKQDATLDISVNNGVVSGNFIHPKMGAIALYDGRISGDSVSVKCNTNDGPMQWTLRVTGATMQGTWKAGTWSGNVQLTRR